MEETRTPRFTAETRIDLPVFREFLNLSIDVYSRNTVFRLMQAVLVLLCIANMRSDTYIITFFFLAVLFPLAEWWNRRKYKDGGVAYKQLLFQYEENIPHQMYRFEEAQLEFQNLITGKERPTPYSSFVRIWESKNLLILISDINLYHIIDKRTLTGGTSDELVTFLREKCPNLKKLSKGRLGKYIRRALWVVIAIGLIVAVLHLLNIPEKLADKITNDMSYQEMAEKLSELDIIIDPATIEEMEAYEDSAWDSPGFLYEDYARVLYLLSWEGMGQYDYNTWEWTPSTSGVYWFDMEVMDVSSMYTDFLRGVDAMDETIGFSNITEDYSGCDLESGQGIVIVGFDHLGEHYELEARYNYDWFDLGMLHELGSILNSDGDPKNLWYLFDDGQGLLLYYGTDAQASTLQKKTGLDFLPCVLIAPGS